MRRFLHGAAIFWRGGAVLAVLVLGGFVYRAYAVPEIFESDAVVEIVTDPAADGLASTADRLRGAIFDPRSLEQLTVDAPPVAVRDGESASSAERTRRAIDVRPLGDSKFTIVFRGGSAVMARRGCDALVAVASQRLTPVRASAAATTAEEVRQKSRLLEERTRELATFVAQHPELAGKRSDGADGLLGRPGVRPQTAQPAPTADSVLPILLQQKERLEERIATAEKAEIGSDETTGKSANGDSLQQVDRAGLQKMLGQVKAAITARQVAAQRARANSGESTSEGSDPSQPSAVQVEWQRLVQAVVEAQQSPKEGPAPTSLRVVRAASTPSLPIQPNRPLLALLGVTAGLWAGIVWAFLRVALGHHRTPATQYKAAGLPAFPIDGEPAAVLPEVTSEPRLAVPPPAFLTESDVVKEGESAPAPEPVPAAAPAKKKRDKNAPLPSFPIDPESAKAVDDATSASLAAAKIVAPPADSKPTTPVPIAVAPVVAVAPGPSRAALPSFPIEPESAKAIDEATSGGPRAEAKPIATVPKEATSSPRVESQSPTVPKEATSSPRVDALLPKVIISTPEASPLPSFPMDAESAIAVQSVRASTPAVPTIAARPVAAEKATPHATPAVEKGQPVFVVDDGQRTSVAPHAPVSRSPYAAIVEATRTSAPPPAPAVPGAPLPSPAAATAPPAHQAAQPVEPRRPSRHPSWTPLPLAQGTARSPTPNHTAHAPDPAATSAHKNAPTPPTPMMAHIEASPIMGIEDGVATTASGKRGVSVHPPSGPPVVMRAGSEAPEPHAARAPEAAHAAHAQGRPARRITQTLGSPEHPSAAPTQVWTPSPDFGSHTMPRPSDAPPAYASIPAPPAMPSQLGPSSIEVTNVAPSRRATPPIAQTLPVGSTHGDVAAAHEAHAEGAKTALAIVKPDERRARVETPAASSVISDVPKGWSPHPSLSEHESIDELSALRDQLYRLAGRESFVVGVSSGPEMAAFKSGVAARLAWMLAQPGHARVLLMEGDFDHPVVHRLMRIDMPLAAGFSEQMRKRMNGSKPNPWTIVRCAPNLHVLAEGLVRSPGLLPSVQFSEAVSELRRSYDLIVIDAPSGGMSADTRALDGVADGIVLAGDRDLLDRASHWYSKKRLMAVVTAGLDAGRGR